MSSSKMLEMECRNLPVDISESRLPLCNEAPLRAEMNERDEFWVDDAEEEFLVVPADFDSSLRSQDGQRQTLHWR